MAESGIINLNKPSGISSAAAVGAIRRISRLPCGHMGTLDPLASGVLPVAVGNATRLFGYLLDKEKTYAAVFRFGEETDTLDTEGTVLRTGGRVPAEDEIRESLPAFAGEIDQIPPQYSAKSIGGVRAYALARRGEHADLAARRVKVFSFELTGRRGAGEYAFRIRCGAGTYIRALGRDLAAHLGTCAVMTELVREASGIFRIEDSVTPADLNGGWRDFLFPPDSVVDYPCFYAEGEEARRLRNGMPVPSGGTGFSKLYLDGAFYGIAESADGMLRAKTKLV